jgi:hypothetical protein
MEEVMEYGQMPVFQIQHMMMPIKVFLSASAVHLPLGILLQVIAITLLRGGGMWATVVTIGRLRLVTHTLLTCAFIEEVAALIHPASTIGLVG